MKKLFLVIIFIISIASLNIFSAYAVTEQPTSALPKTSTTRSESSSSAKQALDEELNTQINQLKERIASRVAQLNLVEKRGVIGIVTDTSGNQVAFTDLAGKTRYIDVDEITKFSSPSAKNSFGLSDLVKGTKINVLGLYNKQSRRILARFIDSIVTPVYLYGRISQLDKKNFTISVISENRKQTKVDVQTITLISMGGKEQGIKKIGFSKLSIGDNVLITGFPDKKDASLLVASRILSLPDLPKNPKIIIPESIDLTETPPASRSSQKTN